MNIIPSKNFSKKVKKLPQLIKTALISRLRLFTHDTFNIILNNHPLKGSKKHLRSININGDYRLIYEQYDKNTVYLIDIDTHSNLY